MRPNYRLALIDAAIDEAVSKDIDTDGETYNEAAHTEATLIMSGTEKADLALAFIRADYQKIGEIYYDCVIEYITNHYTPLVEDDPEKYGVDV